MTCGRLLLLIACVAPQVACAQPVAPTALGATTNYQAVRTWHEQHLATSPDRAARLDALRRIVRSGMLGERGLQRIFNDFEGRASIDPTIPGVEKTARLLASSNRSQVKGHTRELLYAIQLHNDGRNTLVEMGRKLDRPWGRTDADIVIRHRGSGLYGRIEVKDYSLRSQVTNQAKLKLQMSKMAREGQLTGQPQFWINRRGMTPELRLHAQRLGIVALDRIGTGRRLSSDSRSFDTVLARMDREFAHHAGYRGKLGGTMIGLGTSLLMNSLPEVWSAAVDLSAPGEARTDTRMRLASSSAYSLGSAGLIVSGSALTVASRFSELNQTRLVGFGRFGAGTSMMITAVGIAIDLQRYRQGYLSADMLWESTAHATVEAGVAAAGAWIGGSLAAAGTANPVGIGAGAMAGSLVANTLLQTVGDHVLEERVQSERRRLDQAFGNAVSRRYGV